MTAAPLEVPASEPAPAGARRLSELAVGESGTIARVDAADAIASRLRDLGFIVGTPVTVRGRAPLGDPRIYELRGTRFCLRRREAATIQVIARDAGAAP